MTALKSIWIPLIYAAWNIEIHCSNGLLEAIDQLSVSATTVTDSINDNMISNDSLFQQVPLDTNEQTACSPDDPGINWRGVTIRAPSRVFIPDKISNYSAFIIPICGLYLVDAAKTFEHPGPRTLIVTDEASGQVYKGALLRRIPEPTVPPPRSRPVSPSTKTAFGDYFNINAAAYVNLPIRPAMYRVRVEYAGYQSNELTIAVTGRP